MKKTILLPTLAVAVALVIAGCGGDGNDDEGDPKVIATTEIAADIVRQVAGEELEVAQLVPSGVSPHGFSPSAREQEQVTNSELLVFFSLALERSLPLTETPNRFEISAHVGDIRRVGEDGEIDPHVWMDPLAIFNALRPLADELAKVKPESREVFIENARRMKGQMIGLNGRIRLMFIGPNVTRKLVTSHDSLGWFADRYKLEVVGTALGISPEEQASAGSTGELIDRIEREKVPAVFAQTGDDPELLQTIAKEAGVEVVDDLLIESFNDEVGSYAEMVETTAERIADGLSG